MALEESKRVEPQEMAALVTKAKDGDREAFNELVRATSAATYTLAYRLVGNEEDARDVVQEAYLKSYRAIKDFRSDAQFSTWMYRITANCASTHVRSRRRHRYEELPDETTVVDQGREVDPEAAAAGAELRSQLVAALSELPSRMRAVVVLRDVYDLTHAEIADHLGVTETAAKVRLHRARRRLRSSLFPPAGESRRSAL